MNPLAAKSATFLVWNKSEAEENCRILERLGDLNYSECNYFMFVPDSAFRVSGTNTLNYQRDHPYFDVYLVRVDTSDCRHVMFGFAREENVWDFSSAMFQHKLIAGRNPPI